MYFTGCTYFQLKHVNDIPLLQRIPAIQEYGPYPLLDPERLQVRIWRVDYSLETEEGRG